MENEQLVSLTADIVASHVSHNSVAVGEVGNLVRQVHEALARLGENQPEEPQAKVAVVSVRDSVKPDFIVCMECGKRQKTLKRHLQTAHQMTPDQYRKDYGLPREYPMVAPNYSERRSEMAKSRGFGKRKGADEGGASPSAEAAPDEEKKARRRRRPKAAAPAE